MTFLGKEIHLEFPIHPSTECCRIANRAYIFTVDNESFFIKFLREEGIQSYLN